MPFFRLLIVLLLLSTQISFAHDFNIKEGFVSQIIATGLQDPTSIAVAPDGRVFICEKKVQYE